jgi:hypothetical protein
VTDCSHRTKEGGPRSQCRLRKVLFASRTSNPRTPEPPSPRTPEPRTQLDESTSILSGPINRSSSGLTSQSADGQPQMRRVGRELAERRIDRHPPLEPHFRPGVVVELPVDECQTRRTARRLCPAASQIARRRAPCARCSPPRRASSVASALGLADRDRLPKRVYTHRLIRCATTRGSVSGPRRAAARARRSSGCSPRAAVPSRGTTPIIGARGAVGQRVGCLERVGPSRVIVSVSPRRRCSVAL